MCGCNCPLEITTATQVATSAVQALALAANASRKNATFMNLTSVPVSVYFTTGQGATAPYILAQGAMLSLAQGGVGVYTGNVYAVSGSAGLLGVTEET